MALQKIQSASDGLQKAILEAAVRDIRRKAKKAKKAADKTVKQAAMQTAVPAEQQQLSSPDAVCSPTDDAGRQDNQQRLQRGGSDSAVVQHAAVGCSGAVRPLRAWQRNEVLEPCTPSFGVSS